MDTNFFWANIGKYMFSEVKFKCALQSGTKHISRVVWRKREKEKIFSLRQILRAVLAGWISIPRAPCQLRPLKGTRMYDDVLPFLVFCLDTQIVFSSWWPRQMYIVVCPQCYQLIEMYKHVCLAAVCACYCARAHFHEHICNCVPKVQQVGVFNFHYALHCIACAWVSMYIVAKRRSCLLLCYP